METYSAMAAGKSRTDTRGVNVISEKNAGITKSVINPNGANINVRIRNVRC